MAEAFASRLRDLERTRARVEKLYTGSKITRRDAEHVYGAIFIGALSSFEAMIEDLFFTLLTSHARNPASIRSKAIFRSYSAARALVFGERKYLDWVPYEWTEKRATQFFYGGRPFTRLGQADTTLIKKVCVIRNAIAHKDGYARKKFDREITLGLPLAPRERTPAGFLRSLHSSAPNVTRYEVLIGELTSIARTLTR